MGMWRSVGVLVVVGCRAAPEPAVEPVKHRAQPVDVDTKLAEAARLHDAHFKLDYARPFERASVGDSPATGLYLDACRSGRKQACWIAMQIAYQDIIVRDPKAASPRSSAPGRWSEAAKLVEANCREGDHASCLALPAAADSFGIVFPVRGAAGRSAACSGTERMCSEPAMREECEAGFWYSCRKLSLLLLVQAVETRKPGLEQSSRAALRRSDELASALCTERIANGCMPIDDAPVDVQLAAKQTWCELGRRCSPLADEYLARGNTLGARDAAERGCQFFLDRCAELGVMYLDGALPEPVPGRGQALVNWVCASLPAGNAYKPCVRARL
jgi:hypothetical protein